MDCFAAFPITPTKPPLNLLDTLHQQTRTSCQSIHRQREYERKRDCCEQYPFLYAFCHCVHFLRASLLKQIFKVLRHAQHADGSREAPAEVTCACNVGVRCIRIWRSFWSRCPGGLSVTERYFSILLAFEIGNVGRGVLSLNGLWSVLALVIGISGVGQLRNIPPNPLPEEDSLCTCETTFSNEVDYDGVEEEDRQ